MSAPPATYGGAFALFKNYVAEDVAMRKKARELGVSVAIVWAGIEYRVRPGGRMTRIDRSPET